MASRRVRDIAARCRRSSFLVGGLALFALGSLASAIAPSFKVLAAAQVALGAGVAAVLSAGVAAAAEWARPDQRTRVLSWALLGQPAAWVAGMPLLVALGVVASVGIACFGTVRPAAWVSAAIFTFLVFIAGARTIVASAFGLHVAPRHRVAVMSIRAAATQLG